MCLCIFISEEKREKAKKVPTGQNKPYGRRVPSFGVECDIKWPCSS